MQFVFTDNYGELTEFKYLVENVNLFNSSGKHVWPIFERDKP